ncbi:uncharacterized protein LOC113239390 [Hyposmocoma kahamanoa]|uniref:uncharacterized protein LOC113239390 n=1 Tax=Hyposmocoma kahamanoa TaxID=1477025 RepID=UPI000E6D9C95|nr:uncharacterized protein LOC113239390 [Hyposmocoma kahamanoa]
MSDNLHTLIGKNPKKKKQKKKPQPNRVWIRPQAPITRPRPLMSMPVYPPIPNINAPRGPPVVFQAPHQQPETMIDLFDDTAPSTPLLKTPLPKTPLLKTPLLKTPLTRTPLLQTPVGNWKPVIQEAVRPSEADQLTASALEERWKRFQENLRMKRVIDTCLMKTVPQQNKNKKPNPRPKPKPKPRPQARTEPIIQAQMQPKPKTEKEIRWELNSLDEKEEPICEQKNNADQSINISPQQSPSAQDKTALNPKIIEGIASEIKFVVHKKPELQPSIMREDSEEKNKTRSSTPSSTASMNNPQDNRNYPTPKTIMDYMQAMGNYPKGVPRSFLKQQQNFGAIQPQDCSNSHISELNDGSLSPNSAAGQKRLSAFQRLGPPSQPKKPKLTINLLCNSDQSVREVVDKTEEEDKYLPVHQRKDILESTDEIVQKYLTFWPWKRNLNVRRSVTSRHSKSVMILELEQMEEVYEKDNIFIQVALKGYPSSWRKEQVLDALLDNLKGKSFIPCFTEFTPQECKFAVIRSRAALSTIHKLGFNIRKDDVELSITISNIDLSINMLDFIPRLVLRKVLSRGYDGERQLDLSAFTLKSDISHFIYFPLHRLTNQSELLSLQSTVAWNYLTDLDLSHNRLTTLDGFDLPKTTPKLKHLDLSYNNIERVTTLLRCRELSLHTIKLEGNPLCHDYIDPREYVRIIRMIYPGLVEIDGVQFQRKGEFPKNKRNYCPTDAKDITDKFLGVFFNLLESPHEDRGRIEELYHEKAVLTITHRYNMRYRPIYRYYRNLFLRARSFEEGEMESVEGATSIAKLINKWPMLQHDPYTFNVDVIHHNDTSTVIRINGMLKQIVESLAEDEHLLAFTRTVVLSTTNGVEYKIQNELLYWEEPCRDYAHKAFHINALKFKKPSLKLDSPPDEELKEKLLDIFVKITEAEKRHAEKCLEFKDWNLKIAIEYYAKLVKLDDLHPLND